MECAFVTSDLPVILSMEMHCSKKQQRSIAITLMGFLRELMVPQDELAQQWSRPMLLTAQDLTHRVLVKGKIKGKVKQPALLSKAPTPARSRFSRLFRNANGSTRSQLGLKLRGDARPEVEMKTHDDSLRSISSEPTTPVRRPTCSSGGGNTTTFGPLDDDDALMLEGFEGAACRRDMLLDDRFSRAQIRATLFDDNFSLVVRARKKVRRRSSAAMKVTDSLYGNCLALRSVPVSDFLSKGGGNVQFPITSISEPRLLKELGLSPVERNQIQGLTGMTSSSVTVRGGSILTEAQLATIAIVRLAHDPPTSVGKMQRITAEKLLRPYPHGLRFSGKNMSPLPCWLTGAQHVALNFSNSDLAAQLHFALFAGSGGMVLKPPTMRKGSVVASERRTSSSARTNSIAETERQSTMPVRDSGAMVGDDDRAYWPLSCDNVQITSVNILSLHNLPKRREQRPRYDGSCGACHDYVPELSGDAAPPDDLPPSSPCITVSLHPIGGFCAVSNVLPLKESSNETDLQVAKSVDRNGLNAVFKKTVHCVASEPHETFLRVSVTDGDKEVANEIAVLGRLRRGYRVLLLRGPLGTRIELAYLFVHIAFSSERNLWATPRQLRFAGSQHRGQALWLQHQLEVTELELSKARSSHNGRAEERRSKGSELSRASRAR